MAKRKIIKIDEQKCNGCGLCIPNCPEGALQIIDKRVRLVSELFCDGLGACIGHCPEGAITIEERDAEKYDERKVMKNIIKQGKNVIKAHLAHLKEHNETAYLKEATGFLRENDIEVPNFEKEDSVMHGRTGKTTECPGTKAVDFGETDADPKGGLLSRITSQLRQWPIQLHLISPTAPYYKGADVILAADCTAYALGSFHQDYLKGKSIAIACPKLDNGQDVYVEKIKSWLEDAGINTITVLIMQVPCCMGLLNLAKQAVNVSKRKVPIKSIVIGIHGEVLKDEWA